MGSAEFVGASRFVFAIQAMRMGYGSSVSSVSSTQSACAPVIWLQYSGYLSMPTHFARSSSVIWYQPSVMNARVSVL